jgi:pimeloyl-ACP methyl ester carboxylesterase
VFALVPDALTHAVAGFAFYRSKSRLLDPKLRELGQTRTGWARGSQFVFSQHCKAARSAGLSDAQVDAIPSWQTAATDLFSPLERAVLAYTDALTLDGGRVPDATFAALRAGGLSDEQYPRAHLHRLHLRDARHHVPRPPPGVRRRRRARRRDPRRRRRPYAGRDAPGGSVTTDRADKIGERTRAIRGLVTRMEAETRYAKSGDVNVAYQVVGDGPLDLVLVPGWVSDVEQAWEDPSFAAFLRRLTSFARLILLDRRGTGLSDRVAELPGLEERMDDVRAVMDAAGSQRAALFGISEGGPMCMLFAATYPQRTSALVLYGSFARNVRDDDAPWGHSPAAIQHFVEQIEREWGTGITARMFAPSLADDERFVREWARFERRAVSPGGARVLLGMALGADVRAHPARDPRPHPDLHRVDDQMTRVEGARYMAAHIPGREDTSSCPAPTTSPGSATSSLSSARSRSS